MIKKYLSIDGVAYLWSKIKEYINSKQPQPIEIQDLSLLFNANDNGVLDGIYSFEIDPDKFRPIKEALANGATECPFVIRQLYYYQSVNDVIAAYYYKNVYSTMKRMLVKDSNTSGGYSYVYTFALDLPNLTNHTNEHLHLHNSSLFSLTSQWYIETHATSYASDIDIDQICNINNNL